MKLPSGPIRAIVRVLVADSNQTQSQLLSAALRRQSGFKVTCCRAELSECLEALELSPADILLMGDGLPNHGHQYEVLRALHTAYPKLGLILLLDSYDRDLVVNAMRSGARGLFCQASQPFKALCRCIHSVHKGQIWANTEQLQYVLDALMLNPAMRVTNSRGEDLLTPREDQVVGLVAEGASNRDIAERLNIKENTVKKSLLRIYDKLGVSNRVELVLYALTHHGMNPAESISIVSSAVLPEAPHEIPSPKRGPSLSDKLSSAVALEIIS
jgi:two-component system, NarL family, response regulator DegU